MGQLMRRGWSGTQIWSHGDFAGLYRCPNVVANIEGEGFGSSRREFGQQWNRTAQPSADTLRMPVEVTDCHHPRVAGASLGLGPMKADRCWANGSDRWA
ncbi:unannotated protein [freshwater metagenome]|uniref:Unannotated protein n=1 Tax=freshwater metagenome TaxID=449393 RepID=A0A6J6NCM5_9ZZZZ